MGNCSALCSGVEEDGVHDPQKKQIDANQMREAVDKNEAARVQGNAFAAQYPQEKAFENQNLHGQDYGNNVFGGKEAGFGVTPNQPVEKGM